MFLIDRRYFRYFDFISFVLLLCLSSISLLFVYSATYTPAQPHSLFFKKQLFGIASGFGIYFIFSTFDFRSLARWGYFIYFLIVGLLLFTLIKGSIGMGAQRWIDIGIVKFQPSELAKLFLPSFIAFYTHTQESPQLSLYDCLPLLGIIALSFMLILKQPDLGTALLILFTALVMIWLAGLPKKYFIIAFSCVLFTAPLSWNFLKPYQQQRILVFLGQGQAHKERYQIEQSKIAIGSGGILGKGLRNGTQNQLMFLPESRTDFIFSVVGEEWGLLGALLILFLFAALFARIFLITATLHTSYYQLLAIGLLMPCIFATLINIGMVTGLMPIVGIPLPFMSYGITHLWISFATFGWLNSIAIRRFYTGIAERRIAL